jgi:hypothetical protein
MLLAQTVSNYENVSFTQSTDQPHVLIISQTDQYNWENKIGRFDFYNKEGYLLTLQGSKKEYKQFNSLLNNFFKYNEYFGYTDTDIKACKQAGDNLIKEENKQREQEFKQAQTDRATEFLNGILSLDEKTINVIKLQENKDDNTLLTLINNTFKNVITKKLANDILNAMKDYFNGNIESEINECKEVNNTTDQTENNVTDQSNVSYQAFNRSFSSYEDAYTYCVSNDFSTDYIEEVATMQPSNAQQTNNDQPEKVTYYFYTKTFDTYMDAYNHALNNRSSVTMILPSNHPTMSNERLQQLEKEYTFSKMNMSYEDMKEYFAYISSLSETLDQQDRYFKLKQWIKRYEDKQQRIKEKKEKQRYQMEESGKMLQYMESKGLTHKSIYSMTHYYYKGEKVHTWMSGCSTEEYYNGVKGVYDKYFKPYIKQSEAI